MHGRRKNEGKREREGGRAMKGTQTSKVYGKCNEKKIRNARKQQTV